VASRALIDAALDGHTLMLATNAIAANVALYKPAQTARANARSPLTRASDVGYEGLNIFDGHEVRFKCQKNRNVSLLGI
jgi:hypothetical protein